jgi:hypothetical protein
MWVSFAGWKKGPTATQIGNDGLLPDWRLKRAGHAWAGGGPRGLGREGSGPRRLGRQRHRPRELGRQRHRPRGLGRRARRAARSCGAWARDSRGRRRDAHGGRWRRTRQSPLVRRIRNSPHLGARLNANFGFETHQQFYESSVISELNFANAASTKIMRTSTPLSENSARAASRYSVGRSFSFSRERINSR